MTDNRAKILACAMQLFAARGYDAVGVQEIVDAVGIAKPTLYHFFGSKAGGVCDCFVFCFEGIQAYNSPS